MGTAEEEDAKEQLTEKEKKAVEQREYDIEALRQANSNVERTINQVVRSFPQTANKSIEIVKLNGIVISIFVVSAQLNNELYSLNRLVIGSIILFGISILTGLLGYMSQNIIIGLKTQKVLLRRKLTEEEYLRWLLEEEYDRWLEQALSKHRRKSILVQISLTTFVAALITFLVGIYFGA